MTDFVLKTKEETPYLYVSYNSFDFNKKVVSYAQFLKQPLILGMFVPCSDKGDVLEKPKSILIYQMQCGECSEDEMRINREYLEAKERVLFEGFKLCTRDKNTLCVENDFHLILNHQKNIEDIVKYNITLTKSAIKKLGLWE